jgi:hypothetical protein
MRPLLSMQVCWSTTDSVQRVITRLATMFVGMLVAFCALEGVSLQSASADGGGLLGGDSPLGLLGGRQGDGGQGGGGQSVANPPNVVTDTLGSVEQALVPSGATGKVPAAGADEPSGTTLSRALPATQVLDPVTQTLGPVLETAQPVIEAAQPVLDAVEPVLEPVEPVLDAAVAPVVQAAAPVVEAVQPAIDAVVEPVAQVIEPVVQAVEPVIQAVEPTVQAVAPIVETAVDPVVQTVAPVLDSAVQTAGAIDVVEMPAAVTGFAVIEPAASGPRSGEPRASSTQFVPPASGTDVTSMPDIASFAMPGMPRPTGTGDAPQTPALFAAGGAASESVPGATRDLTPRNLSSQPAASPLGFMTVPGGLSVPGGAGDAFAAVAAASLLLALALLVWRRVCLEVLRSPSRSYAPILPPG